MNSSSGVGHPMRDGTDGGLDVYVSALGAAL
jgi:hypothetical protein